MFPRNQRLSRQKDIDDVFKRGRSYSTPLFVLKVFANQLGHHRVTVVVSNKTERSAVNRNRMKRKTRHALRVQLADARTYCDVVVILRSGVLTVPYKDLLAYVRRGLIALRMV